MSAHRTAHRALTCALVAAAGAVTAGCASLSPDATAAADVAVQFHAAVAGGDGAAACDLLAPAVVAELEGSGTPCEDAVVATDVPDASQVLQARADGRAAQVRLRGDVVFLTASGSRWLVTAAACTPRSERPYDCEISEG